MKRFVYLSSLAACGMLCISSTSAWSQEESTHPRGKPEAAIPRPGITLESGRVALVVTDPQNDFLSPDGVTWGVVGKSVIENGTVEHLDELFATAHATDIPVFISPHYYFPHDHQWKFEGALERLMHDIGMFDRPSALSTTGFEGSGADWLPQYKKYINHENCVVTSPHKVYGPDTNDLVLQLRKRGIDQVILAGMSANLCTESHMRSLIEQGFEVVVVADATAGAIVPEYNTYEAAYINYRFIASDVWLTTSAVKRMHELSDGQEIHSSSEWIKKKVLSTGGYSISQGWRGRTLRLNADFKTDEAPDLKVALSPIAASATTDANALRGALVLGDLKNFNGSTLYEIPEDVELESYKSLVIYCEAYSILWSASEL